MTTIYMLTSNIKIIQLERFTSSHMLIVFSIKFP
jgi:hypothetical protein